MLVQLSYNSKSGKSTQFAVYEFPDHLSLNSAIYTLKRTGAKKANKENTKFQEIDSWNKNDGSLIEIHKATMEVAFKYGNDFKKFSMPELWLLQNAKMLDLNYLYSYPKGFEFKGASPNRRQKLLKNILYELGHPIFRAKQPNGYTDLEDEWLSPELIIRRLASARKFTDIVNPNLNYDNDFFEKVIISNFDKPEKFLKLMDSAKFYSDRFVVFANYPEMMRA